MKLKPTRFRTRAKAAIELLSGGDSNAMAKAAQEFAKRHEMIYFGSVSAGSAQASVVRGSSASHDQIDRHICIGSYDGYDVTYVERTASVQFADHPPSAHQWSIMTFDLHSSRLLPLVFIGTAQQSKAYYARLLSIRRELRQVQEDTIPALATLRGKYVALASPSAVPGLQNILDASTVKHLSQQATPFALEIEHDSLSIITDRLHPSAHELQHMLVYGAWLARQIDERFV